MDDLISRQAVLDKLKDFSNMYTLEEEARIVLDTIVRIVTEQPTAYDVEKVVAELEEIKQDWKMKEQERGLNFMDCVILREYQKHYDKAIDIVRKGGAK